MASIPTPDTSGGSPFAVDTAQLRTSAVALGRCGEAVAGGPVLAGLQGTGEGVDLARGFDAFVQVWSPYRTDWQGNLRAYAGTVRTLASVIEQEEHGRAAAIPVTAGVQR